MRLEAQKKWILTILTVLFLSTSTYSQYCVPRHDPGWGMIVRAMIGDIATQEGVGSDNVINRYDWANSQYTHFSNEIAKVEEGKPFDILIQPMQGEKRHQVMAWIDWNQDNKFDGPDEKVFATVGGDGWLFKVSPPASATAGKQFRVRLTLGSIYTPLEDACTFRGGGGETEDYTLEIIPKNTTPLPEGVGPDCENSGFESGSLDGWDMYVGCHRFKEQNGYPCDRNLPPTNVGWCCGTPNDDRNPDYGRVAIAIEVAGGVVEKTRNAVPPVQLVPPGGGGFSVRLGDGDLNGGYAFQVRKTFRVTQDNALLTYWYCLVMNETQGHGVGGNPYFQFAIYDGNGRGLDCADFFGHSDTTQGSFNSIPDPDNGAQIVNYRDWKKRVVNLLPYVGTDVTVEATSSDCGVGGHYGIAYFDMECSPLNLVKDGGNPNVCKGSTDSLTLEAPGGEGYEYFWSTGSNSQAIKVAPKENTSYTVQILVPGTLCPIEFEQEVKILDPIEVYNNEVICEIEETGRFVLTFDVTGGDPDSYKVIDQDGNRIGGVITDAGGDFFKFESEPIESGIYQFEISDTAECNVVRLEHEIECPITCVQPTVKLSEDVKVCGATDIEISAEIIDALPDQLSWEMDGGNINNFDLTDPLKPRYKPVPIDYGKEITIRLTATPFPGPCSAVIDEMRIFIEPPPTITMGTVPETCVGDGTFVVDGTGVVPFGGDDPDNPVDFPVQWKIEHGGGKLVAANVMNPSYVIDATDENDTVVLVIEVVSGKYCNGLFDTLEIPIKGRPSVRVPRAISVCAGEVYTPKLSMIDVENASSVSWEIVNGLGELTNTTMYTPTYKASADDVGKDVRLKIMVQPNGNCSDKAVEAEIMLRVAIPPTAEVPADPMFACWKDTIPIEGVTASNFTSIAWSTDGSGSFSNELNKLTNYNVAAADTIGIELQFIAYAQKPCQGDVIKYIDVDVNKPSWIWGYDEVYCASDIGNEFPIDRIKFGDVESYVWELENGDGTLTKLDQDLNSYVISEQDKQDTVKVKITAESAAPCPSSEAMFTLRYASKAIQVDTPVVCAGDPITLVAGSRVNNYHWYNQKEDTTPIFTGNLYEVTNLQDSRYFYIGPIDRCPEDRDSIQVIVHPYPTADFEIDVTEIRDMQGSLVVSDLSEDASTGTWNFDSYLIKDYEINKDTVVVNYAFEFAEEEGVYQILLQLENEGCKTEIEKQIPINITWAYFVPNTFSPNGDGVNDRFKGKGYGILSFNMKIFDRWGTMVYDSDDETDSWDGYFRNQKAPIDQYVYKIKLVNVFNSEKVFTGGFHLIR